MSLYGGSIALDRRYIACTCILYAHPRIFESLDVHQDKENQPSSNQLSGKAKALDLLNFAKKQAV